jgi:hypothetical protein
MIIAVDVVALWGCAPTAAARTSKPPDGFARESPNHRHRAGERARVDLVG